ncbi:MAG: hypothetical protein ACKVP5_17790 [Aestuariivirga sp.]
MSDPTDDNDFKGSGVTWRLSQSENQGVTALDSPIVFELTNPRGSILASVFMPSETISELLRPHLSIYAALQLDGSVSLDSEYFALFPPSKTTDIYELVSEGLAPEMLEDELDVKNRLTTLRNRLTDALALVDQTLATLDKDRS